MNAPALPAMPLGLPRWPGWTRLPRDQRDTLFQLIVIGWTVLPHFAHLPLWCSALTVVVLLWRAWLAVANRALPGRWVLVAVLAVAAGLTLLTERTLLGKEAGVSMLVVLVGMKTLESRGRRDALVVFFLGFFLVLTHCLYSQSLWIALSMIVSTWGLLTAQVLASMPVGLPSLQRASAIALRSAALGVPLMLLLFLLFPRFGPLWGLPQDALGRTGLSGTLRLGGVAEIANDDSIAFRVRFTERQPTADQLYFRGPVLSRFDGVEWRANPPGIGEAARSRAEIRGLGPALPYEMTIEPIRLALLPLIEATPDVGESAPKLAGWTFTLTPEMQWLTDRLVAERIRIEARAWPRYELGARSGSAGLWELTQLPPNSNPRALAWARALRAEPRFAQAGARALAGALMEHIRTERFTYTLAPGGYGRDAVDEFWFGRRLGFCEHFAVSFTVMMRSMGIPARVITGYQGAEPRDADGWRIVRQSHAHAWAEYWLAGAGWVRADPTAAVAPDRVIDSRSLAPRPGLVASTLRNFNPELFAQLRNAFELLDNRWNQWVMSYSRTRQFDLLQSLGFASPDWTDLALALAAVLSAAALAGAAWAWLDRHRVDPWLRAHRRIRDSLAALGVAVQPHHDPRRLAALLRQAYPHDEARPLSALLDELDAARYGPAGQRLPGNAWRAAFERELGKLERVVPGAAPG